MITRHDYRAGTLLCDTDTSRSRWISAPYAPAEDATQEELRQAMQPAPLKYVVPMRNDYSRYPHQGEID